MTAQRNTEDTLADDTPHVDRPKLRGRPRKDHAPVIGSDILKAATELFGELGYRGTSMEAVALKVGIAKRTLYVRYPDKASLFKDVVESIITNAKNPEPPEFPDLRTCISFHTENYFVICSDPSMRVLYSIADNDVQNVPELASIGQELTLEIGIKRIAKTIAETARKDGVTVEDPEFIAASLLDLAEGHFTRVKVLKLRSDFASFKYAAERIVNLLMAGIQAGNSRV